MRFSFAVAVGLAALLVSTAGADVVELQTGERLEGEVRYVTPSEVVLQVAGQPVTLARDKVKTIIFGGLTPGSDGSINSALTALKSLQSATRAGLVYRDYSARVADAKISVDKGLASGSNNSDASRAIQSAMTYYITASSVWSHNAGEIIYNVWQKELPEECSHYRTYLAEFLKTYGKVDREFLERRAEERYGRNRLGVVRDGRLIATSGIIQVYWSCASDKIAEAETALKSKGQR